MQIKLVKYSVAFFILFLITPTIILGQEYLDDLSINIDLKNRYSKEKVVLKRGHIDVLNLPFFDDFSDLTSVVPDNTKWIDQSVYINDNYGENQPTIGVATFDAIDSYGDLYPFNDTASTMNGDTLTSHYIDASGVAVSDSLYLSFFVQGGGLGNIPQEKDSIFLQFMFKGVDTSYWKTVWSRVGEQMHRFEPVIIPVVEQELIHDSLQFRFINKFSLEYAGMNCDHWNLDYVYLDINRSVNDSLIDEVAYTQNVNKIFNVYSAVPWRHYKQSFGIILDKILFRFRNYKEQVMNITPYLRWTNLYTGKTEDIGNIANNYDANTYYELPKPLNSLFDIDNSDSAKFKVETRFYISQTDFDGNNKTSRIFDLYNYYAYDDGSAEGMYGVSNKFGMVAVKFKTYTQDSLKAIRIYFNKSKYDDNRYFNLMVWDEGGSGPGEVLYKKTRNLPEYADTINGFVTYEFDSAIAVNETFYIGWQKITDQRLNMGFDKNFIAYQKNYFNANGTWELSQFSGSLMIRPVMREMFAYKNSFPEAEENKELMQLFTLYPNPLSNSNLLHIKSKVDYFTVEVYDQMGRLITNVHNEGVVDLSGIKHGLYLVRITAKNEYYTYKIIK
jgi:hypothetical protein